MILLKKGRSSGIQTSTGVTKVTVSSTQGYFRKIWKWYRSVIAIKIDKIKWNKMLPMSRASISGIGRLSWCDNIALDGYFLSGIIFEEI